MSWRLAGPLLALAACTSRDARPAARPAAPTKATLFFTAGLKGYLAPCGCSLSMRGGIARAAFQLEQAREHGEVLFFDGGDALFSSTTIPPEAVPQAERRAKAIAAAFTRMGLNGRVPGPLDDARGAAFRTTLGLPELARDQIVPFTVAGHSFAVVTASSPALVPALGARARAAGARFVVALLEQPFDAALQAAVAPSAGVDLVVATRPRDELAGDENKLAGGAVKAAQLESKGRSLLKVELTLRDGAPFEWLKSPADDEREVKALAERIELLRAQVNEPGLDVQLKALKQAKLGELVARREAVASEVLPVPVDRSAGTARFVSLEASFESLPAVRDLVEAYDRDVGLINLRWAREHGRDCPPATAERPGVVGDDACDECHADALGVYLHSCHAMAYEALVHESKPFHLDCVPCHVTGWQQPGGVCRVDRTVGRRNVGCEACHGPGSAHVADPTHDNIKLGRSKETCVGCHDLENSPHFDFERYEKQIVGPGHGEPLFKRR